jgi:hypothetical protein
MLYWGDYLAIGILLFVSGFIFGWVSYRNAELKDSYNKER